MSDVCGDVLINIQYRTQSIDCFQNTMAYWHLVYASKVLFLLVTTIVCPNRLFNCSSSSGFNSAFEILLPYNFPYLKHSRTSWRRNGRSSSYIQGRRHSSVAPSLKHVLYIQYLKPWNNIEIIEGFQIKYALKVRPDIFKHICNFVQHIITIVPYAHMRRPIIWFLIRPTWLKTIKYILWRCNPNPF